jgi:hypothetical protein
MNKKSKKTLIETGAAVLAAAAATAAGAYFLYGKNGAKNRKKVKGWILKAKSEVLQEMEHMKSMNEDTYHKTIDAMAGRYKILKNIDQKDLNNLVKELKSHWKHIKKDLSVRVAKATKSKKTSKKK